jgi:hypothetical protein
MLTLLIVSAFELALSNTPQAALVAGSVVPDWRNGLSANPSMLAAGHGLQFAAAYANPYGLAGLSWGDVAGAWCSGRLGVGAAISHLGIAGYDELDLRFAAAGEPVAGVSVGIMAHALVRNAGRYGSDMAPAVDVGAAWRGRQLSAGAALQRLNEPRFSAGDELSPRFVVSGRWSPVEQFHVVADLSREGSDDALAVGVEFRLVPQVMLRMGVGTAPLQYSGGLAVCVGPLALEYAYRFHPLLQATHVLGIGASWR